jgi:acyl phosphate:glycerol-3-phosphate acyltransferase
MTLPGVAALLTWVITMKASRYVSLASIVAAVSLPVFVVALGLVRKQPWESLVPFVVVATLLALLVVLRHRTNIQRLMAGTENKVGSAKPD